MTPQEDKEQIESIQVCLFKPQNSKLNISIIKVNVQCSYQMLKEKIPGSSGHCFSKCIRKHYEMAIQCQFHHVARSQEGDA